MLIPGAEPFFFPGGPMGCLLLHGFTASPQVMRGLGLHLSRAGWTAIGIRLPGHGTTPGDMNRVRWQDWMLAVEDGVHMLRNTCEKIFLLGHSTGGALALTYASDHPVDGVVGISTLLHLPDDPRFKLLRRLPFPIRLRIFSWYTRSTPFLKKGPPHWYDWDAHKEYIAYPVNPTGAIIELRHLLGELGRALPEMACPVLLVHSQNDETIPISDAEEILARLGSGEKRLVAVEKSGHVLPLDAERETLYHHAEAFIRSRIEK